MPTISKLRFDESWEPDRNLFYRAYYGDPVSMQKEIRRLFYALRNAIEQFVTLTYEDEELDYLIEDWCELLGKVSAETLSYWEGTATQRNLEDLTEEFMPVIQDELRALRSRPSTTPESQPPVSTPSTTSAVTPSPKKLKKPESQGLDNDLVFSSAFAKTFGFGSAKAVRRPSEVRPKAKPYVPPTPAQEWESSQRKMASECDDGYNRYITGRLNSASDHPVTQPPISERLGGDSYFQVRPSDNTNDEMRIYINEKDTSVQYWARGLSHDKNRLKNTYYLYRRAGNSFVYVSGGRLARDRAAAGL